MAIITKAYSESDGAIAEASSINNIFDQLFTLQAGNLNSANLGTAIVGAGTLKDSAVLHSKIRDLAITGSKIATTANISYGRLDGETVGEVVSASLWETQRIILEGF